jgi:hypothetical protein
VMGASHLTLDCQGDLGAMLGRRSTYEEILNEEKRRTLVPRAKRPPGIMNSVEHGQSVA